MGQKLGIYTCSAPVIEIPFTTLRALRQNDRRPLHSLSVPRSCYRHVTTSHAQAPEIRDRQYESFIGGKVGKRRDQETERVKSRSKETPVSGHFVPYNVLTVSMGRNLQTDPLVHYGRHFGRVVFAFANIHALLIAGIGADEETPPETQQ